MPKLTHKDLSRDNTCENYYKFLPKKTQHLNPDVKNHRLMLPFRALSIGSSGAGKGLQLMELLRRTPNTWDKVIIVIPNSNEPLYNHLRETNPDTMEFFENQEIPKLDYYEGHDNVLCVFDDCLSYPKKKQEQISDWVIRCRKLNISFMYLAQSFYAIPKTIRQNCNYVFIKKFGGKRDMAAILREYCIGLEMEDLMNIYHWATDGDNNFLTIDCSAGENDRFRRNFLEGLGPSF